MELNKKIGIMDDAFSDVMKKKIKESELTKRLGQFLSAVTNKKIEVGISDGKDKEPFFGMRIYPMPDTMDSFLKGMEEEKITFSKVLKSWKSLDAWYLEIDARVLDRNVINFNPQELSALCLHEFAHTLYSESVIERYYNAYREYDVRLSFEDKASKKMLYILNKIPLMLACGAHNWKTGKRGIDEEIFADTTVTKLGYGGHLLSAFEKILKTYGNSIGYTNDSSMDAAIKESIIWCNLNTRDLLRRKKHLNNELYYHTIKSDSSFFKKIIYSILQTLGVKAKEKYTGTIISEALESVFGYENFLQEYDLIDDPKTSTFFEKCYLDLRDRAKNNIATEAFKKSKIKIPTQHDVDSIYVEVDRITNHMDRRYVLDLIYTLIEDIERFIGLFEYNSDLKSKYDSKMKSMLKELESLRKAVLDKRNFDKKYKVFVKYPEGYEG